MSFRSRLSLTWLEDRAVPDGDAGSYLFTPPPPPGGDTVVFTDPGSGSGIDPGSGPIGGGGTYGAPPPPTYP